MIDMELVNAFDSIAELKEVLEGRATVESKPATDTLSTERTRDIDPAMVAACISAGAAMIAPIVQVIVSHVLEKRKKRAEDELRPWKPVHIEVTVSQSATKKQLTRRFSSPDEFAQVALDELQLESNWLTEEEKTTIRIRLPE